jgi:hypothetical protein
LGDHNSVAELVGGQRAHELTDGLDSAAHAVDFHGTLVNDSQQIEPHILGEYLANRRNAKQVRRCSKNTIYLLVEILRTPMLPLPHTQISDTLEKR